MDADVPPESSRIIALARTIRDGLLQPPTHRCAGFHHASFAGWGTELMANGVWHKQVHVSLLVLSAISYTLPFTG